MFREKKSCAEDMTNPFAILPWWSGVALAIVFFRALYRMTAQQVVSTAQLGRAGNV